MATPKKPRLIGDRYELGPVIGRGGMATIHRAMDTRLDRSVAVKLLHPKVARDADLAQRFRREALAATVLRHPNIVPCLDTGTDGDQPFLVMDLIEGEDLAARLKRGGRLAPKQVARIGLDVARALAAAHARGIVHRDIKPGNILLATDGRAMVTDFGIARLAADAEGARPGMTLGSVHYFSPEQARGAGTTPASDVYGLGLVLYEALTGARAWTGETTDEIALARVGAPAPSPRAVRPEVPIALDAVVVRALAPEPADRYPGGSSIAAALESIVQATDDSSPTAVVPSARPASEDPKANADRSPGSKAGSSGTTRLGAVAALASAGVVVGVLLVSALSGVARPLSTALPPESQAAVVTATPQPTPVPSITPAPSATLAPSPTPAPTPEPTDAPTALPPGEVADLCEIFFDAPCGLGAGRYAPSRFEPEFEIELGDGWSNAAHRADIVALTRDAGTITFAGEIREVFPSGRTEDPRSRARDIIEAFIATDGVGATSPADVRIDGRRGLSTDLTPIDSKRVQLFTTEGSTYHLEPDRTTRLVVIDLRGGDTVLLAIEPHDGSALRDILNTADPAAGTIRWR